MSGTTSDSDIQRLINRDAWRLKHGVPPLAKAIEEYVAYRRRLLVDGEIFMLMGIPSTVLDPSRVKVHPVTDKTMRTPAPSVEKPAAVVCPRCGGRRVELRWFAGDQVVIVGCSDCREEERRHRCVADHLAGPC